MIAVQTPMTAQTRAVNVTALPTTALPTASVDVQVIRTAGDFVPRAIGFVTNNVDAAAVDLHVNTSPAYVPCERKGTSCSQSWGDIRAQWPIRDPSEASAELEKEFAVID
jgi:hypothetical protein